MAFWAKHTGLRYLSCSDTPVKRLPWICHVPLSFRSKEHHAPSCKFRTNVLLAFFPLKPSAFVEKASCLPFSYRTFRFPRSVLLPLFPTKSAWIAQTVLRLSMGWTVRGSYSGWEEFVRTIADRPRGPPTVGTGSFLGGNAVAAWCWPLTPI